MQDKPEERNTYSWESYPEASLECRAFVSLISEGAEEKGDTPSKLQELHDDRCIGAQGPVEHAMAAAAQSLFNWAKQQTARADSIICVHEGM